LIGRRAEAFRVCWFTSNLKRTLTPIEILLIEDGAGDVLLFRHALEDYPRPVTLRVARDGEQALQILADPTLNLDLIILDLNLPKVSGICVLGQFGSRKVPIVIFSSSQNAAEIEHALRLGAVEFVQKPIDLDLFDNAVRGMIDRWTGRDARLDD
jgi:two-component system response regulator